MPLDLSVERLTLKETAKLLNVNLSTVWRWTLKGVRGHRLHSFLVGGRRYVSKDDLQEFLDTQNEEERSTSGRRSRKAKQREKSAEHKLDQIGI